MSRKVECDRCHSSEIEGSEDVVEYWARFADERNNATASEEDRIDLCRNCVKQFDEFMKMDAACPKPICNCGADPEHKFPTSGGKKAE